MQIQDQSKTNLNLTSPLKNCAPLKEKLLLKTDDLTLEKSIKCIYKASLLHQPMSQSAMQKPSLKPQTASNGDVEAR